MGDGQRIAAMGLGLRILEAVGIALAVAEAQRVGDRLRQLDGLKMSAIEQGGEARIGRDAQMAAMPKRAGGY